MLLTAGLKVNTYLIAAFYNKNTKWGNGVVTATYRGAEITTYKVEL